MNVYYFSFGQTHVHSVDGFTYDKDVIVAIKAIDSAASRQAMFNYFGDKWGHQYITKPNMSYFPKGIKQLNF